MPDPKKMPKKGLKKMPVYSKASGLDITTKGNQERTDDYIVSSSRNDKFYEEAEKRGVATKPNFTNMPKSKSKVYVSGTKPFTMKYDNSAFPFKSSY